MTRPVPGTESRPETPTESPPDLRLDGPCWVVTEGADGMENQCIALARALGCKPSVKRIRMRRPWRWLPPRHNPAGLGQLDPAADQLAPPWPALLIACGRQSVVPSIAVRQVSRGRCFTVQLQDPKTALDRFDLVVAPRHDRLAGPNVIETIGGLNAVSEASLAEAAERFGPRYAALPRPRVAVLIGGHNRVYRLTEAIARNLGARLAELARREGAGLMVTLSRRTPGRVRGLLAEALAGLPAEIWDGEGENPYFGMLALADAVVVTADSVNMVSEAATTGKPVHVVELAGGSIKFRRFHRALREAGITRPFEGRLESWRYAPLDDTARVAAEVARRLGARQRLGVDSDTRESI